MIIVPRKNLYLPPSRFQQRGSVSVTVFSNAAQQGSGVEEGTVTVSGESISDIGAGDRLYRATLRVDNNGFMYKIVNMSVTAIDTGTDWVRPTSAAGIDYEVKYDKNPGDTLHSSTSLAEGVWGNLQSDKWFEQRWLLGAGIGMKDSNITISIRFQGGAVLDSATYTLNAERLF